MLTVEASFSVTFEPDGDTFPVRPGETLLQGARRQGRWLPFECGWGECGLCKVRLRAGRVEDLYPEAPGLSPQERAKGLILACQSLPRSDLVVRAIAMEAPARPELNVADYKAELVQKDEVGPEIFHLRFRLDRPPSFLPGQYGIFTLEPTLRRAYSFMSLPGSVALEILVKRYPGRPGSQRITHLAPGASLEVELPYGLAYLRPRPGPIALVAGGTGIAPMLAILRELSRVGWEEEVTLIYGARTPEELVLQEEITLALRNLPKAQAIYAAEQAHPHFPGLRGKVTEAVSSLLEDGIPRTWYFAGPPSMVKALKALLRERGVPEESVFYDSFGV
jgi:toluene monooxygenase electron transfer component